MSCLKILHNYFWHQIKNILNTSNLECSDFSHWLRIDAIFNCFQNKSIIILSKLRHQMKIWSWINNLQKTTHQYLKWYWFYRQQYFKRQIIVKYTIMIWPWSDLWNIWYIIIKTGRMRIMKIYLLAKNISEMTFTKFHEIRTCSYKNIRS